MSSPSKNSNSPRSTVYVLDDSRMVRWERGLIAAQRFALAHGLPLAVVATLEGTVAPQSAESLQSAERLLAEYRIPLMLLVGERGNALRSLSGHVSPRLFMQDASLSDEDVVVHPFEWPGHVEPVERVLRIIQNDPEACQF